MPVAKGRAGVGKDELTAQRPRGGAHGKRAHQALRIGQARGVTETTPADS